MKKYVRPIVNKSAPERRDYFPAAAFVGSVVGAVAGRAIFGDDINISSKAQNKLVEVGK